MQWADMSDKWSQLDIVKHLNKYSKDIFNQAASAIRCVNRQNNTTNTAVSNQLEQHGWGYVAGVAATQVADNVTFPVPFDDVPIVIVTPCGAKATSGGAPTGPDSFNLGVNTFVNTQNISTTGVTVRICSPANMSTANNYGYTWRATGTKSR
jgi:hypothetical protein